MIYLIFMIVVNNHKNQINHKNHRLDNMRKNLNHDSSDFCDYADNHKNQIIHKNHSLDNMRKNHNNYRSDNFTPIK
jgi:hypothetical protein